MPVWGDANGTLMFKWKEDHLMTVVLVESSILSSHGFPPHCSSQDGMGLELILGFVCLMLCQGLLTAVINKVVPNFYSKAEL